MHDYQAIVRNALYRAICTAAAFAFTACSDSTAVQSAVVADTFQLVAILTIPIPTKIHMDCRYEAGSPRDLLEIKAGTLIVRTDSTFFFDYTWAGETSTCAPAGVTQHTTYTGRIASAPNSITFQFGARPEDRFGGVRLGDSRIDLPGFYSFEFVRK